MTEPLAKGDAEYIRSVQFRKGREDGWLRLEALIARIEQNGITSLTAAEAQELPLLYRSAMSSLSVARTIVLDRNLLLYLEDLSLRSYLAVYGPRGSLLGRLRGFLTRGFPRAVRAVRWHLAVAFLVFAAGAAAGCILTASDISYYTMFVPEDLADSRGPDSTAEELLKEEIFAPYHGFAASFIAFANSLFRHNAIVGIMSFGLGFLLGLPTVFLLLYNGLVIGAFIALHADKGLTVDFLGWIAIHGITEILAMLLCGAAGLLVAQKIAFPERLSRLDSLARHGREAAMVAAGAVALFFIAGILEGGFRQLINVTAARYAFACATGALWLIYFVRGGGMTPGSDRVGELLEGVKRNHRVLVSPEGVRLDIRLAGNGERLTAFLLDITFLFGAVILLSWLAHAMFFSGVSESVGVTLVLFISFIVRNCYFIHFELAWQGRTPGKKICGLRVINRYGGELTPSAIIARNLTREVEFFLPFSLLMELDPNAGSWQQLALLGWVAALASLPLWSRDNLRAGDLIGGTEVIALPKRVLLGDLTAPVSVSRAGAAGDSFTFSHEQLGIYGAFELQVLEELLRRPVTEGNERLLGEVCGKICRKIGWRGEVLPGEVRRFLTEFYTAERVELERGQLFGRRREDKTEGEKRG